MCRLKRGSGMAGRLSGRNMLAGAAMMMAFVTGPVNENFYSSCVKNQSMSCRPTHVVDKTHNHQMIFWFKLTGLTENTHKKF